MISLGGSTRCSPEPVRRVAPFLAVGIGIALLITRDWRDPALFLVMLGLGATLWLASFSFAGAWRRAIRERRTVGVRGQILLIALTAALFLPVLSAGSVLGQPVRGFVFPVGPALVLGAFLFGLGMQLGAGCGSGTLFTAGGGSARAWITLAGFVAGATLAAWSADWWGGWPSWRPASLTRLFGLAGALAISAVALGAIFLTLWRWERSAHGGVEALFTTGGRWSVGAAAIGLALLGFLTLVLAGRPWTITAAFPLWGSSLVDASGIDDPAFWTFWDEPTRNEALLRPVWLDRTTLMDAGLVLGAAVASWFAKARVDNRLATRFGPALAAILGGALMGFGAVLATGCNIGAMLAGIASGGAHGWIWPLAALPGSALGIALRARFGLDRNA
jgi:uncharacterized membrane protein YedE/YeeE